MHYSCWWHWQTRHRQTNRIHFYSNLLLYKLRNVHLQSQSSTQLRYSLNYHRWIRNRFIRFQSHCTYHWCHRRRQCPRPRPHRHCFRETSSSFMPYSKSSSSQSLSSNQCWMANLYVNWKSFLTRFSYVPVFCMLNAATSNDISFATWWMLWLQHSNAMLK